MLHKEQSFSPLPRPENFCWGVAFSMFVVGFFYDWSKQSI